MPAILAIDQGTTGSRAMVLDERGAILASAYQEFPQYFPQPGWVEHNPEEIWESVRATIEKVLAQAGPGPIAAIGIANQRETTVLWDQATGKPVCNAIVWQCRRTASRCQALAKQKGLRALIQRKTGLPLDAYFSGTKVEWILKNVPAARALARQGRLRFGTTDSWILWKLTGGQTHATDFTNASRTLLFNIEKRQWDPDILKLLKIPKSILPEVKPSSGFFGKTVKLSHLPAGIPISGIAGDQQAALFGQTCFAPGSLKNTYGTGCFILLNTGKKRIHSRHGLITTLGCDEKGQPAFVLEGSVFIAGAAIQWLRDGLKIISQAKDSEPMARSLPSNEGVYFVPALTGLGAPYWDQQARGAIVGLTRGTRQEHLVRAALEAMAYATRDVLETMQKESGLSFASLRVDGGAVANDFLCQFQADILGLAVVRPKMLELTALGAGYLAGLGAGVWTSAKTILAFWQEDKRFAPAMSKAQAGKYYQGWHEAVQRTLTH